MFSTFMHGKSIPSGTYSKTHWTSEPRTFYMSGLNVIIDNRTSLRVERTVQTMPNSKFIFLHAYQNGFIKSWLNEGKDTLKHFYIYSIFSSLRWRKMLASENVHFKSFPGWTYMMAHSAREPSTGDVFGLNMLPHWAGGARRVGTGGAMPQTIRVLVQLPADSLIKS